MTLLRRQQCYRKVFLLTYLSAVLSPCACAKTPLHIGGFFPMTSLHNNGWTGGKGILPAAQLAFDHVNTAGILRDYELRLIWNNTRGSPGWAEHILFEYLHNQPRKIMLLGAGYSSCSTVVASLAGLDPWAIPQISYSSTSPELSIKAKYPHFYRTIPDDNSFNIPRIALLQTFHWNHVGTIFQEEDIHRSAMSNLHSLFLKKGIHRISSESFRDNARVQMENLKKRGARIIIGNFFGKGARQVFCEAYKQGMYGARYVWIVLGYIERNWWLQNDSSVTCSPQEMYDATDGHLATDYLWNADQDTKTVSGKTVGDILAEYKSRVLPGDWDEHRGYAYDSVWAIALALNRSIARLPPSARLDKVPYGDKITSEALTEALKNLSFVGVTGPVGFTDTGDRAGDTHIVQLRDGKKVPVGLYQINQGVINWSGYDPILWKGGSPPPDRTKVIFELMSLSLPLYIFMGVVASIAILISLFFLWFNISHRNIRFIKMSSPNLNNSVILGCAFNYASVFLFGLDGGFISSGYETVCASRAWILSLGFSLAYGAMFSKTWRVHVIFTNKKMKRKVVKDRHLFGVVCLLVIVDVIYLTVWQIMDPMERTIREFSEQSLGTDLDAAIVKQLELCESKATYRWLGILCGYKGLLLLFGAFLAWETRNVTIPALNDSKYIGMSVYNVFVLCIIGAPISLAMRENPDASFAIVSICIVFCTSITLCLVFIPKVLEMKRFATVGDQLCRTFTSNNVIGNVTNTMATVDLNYEQQIVDLKEKLVNKDNEIRELRLRFLNSKNSGQSSEAPTEFRSAEDITPVEYT